MFPNLTLYKTTSSPFTAFRKPIEVADFKLEEKLVTTFSSRSRRKFLDLKPLRDEAFRKAQAAALAEVCDEYPDYEVFISLGKAEILTTTAVPKKLSMFRFTASRSDDSRKIFLTIQLKYETPKALAQAVLNEIPELVRHAAIVE